MENRIVLGFDELFEGLLHEDKAEGLEAKLRDILEIKNDGEKVWTAADHPEPHLFEVGEPKPGDNPWWIEKFDDDEVDFGNLTVYERTPEEKEEGKYIATFMLSGGKNGSGEWTEYLTELTKVFKEIKEKTGAEPLLYKLDTDILDDLWTGWVFLYDHEDKVQESLTEDLIVIEPFEAKEKIEEIKKQIEEAKDWKVRKNLLTLMDIYLFQTLWESDHQEEEGCNINKEEWEEYSDWKQEQGEKLLDEHPELKAENEEREAKIEASLEDSSSEDEHEEAEDLDEAVNYADQVEKMRALENGTRGFNAKAASDEKLKVNRRVCLDKGFYKALRIVEDEMIARGLIQSRTNPAANSSAANMNKPDPTVRKEAEQQAKITLRKDDFTLADAKFVKENPDAEVLFAKANQSDYSAKKLVIYLIFAIILKLGSLANNLKYKLQNAIGITNEDVSLIIKQCTSDKETAMVLGEILQDLN